MLILMRGIPGSGKSTLAKKIAEEYSGAIIFSTDQFHHKNMDFNQPYIFDQKKAGFFHGRNLERAVNAMKEGKVVIIDNTNTVPRDADGYVKAAHELNYKILLREPETTWKFDKEELVKRNQHNVPPDTIAAMIKRWMLHDDFVKHFKNKYPGLNIS